MEPLPPYVGLLAIREKLGCSISELAEVGPYWMAAAANVLKAEELVHEARSKGSA